MKRENENLEGRDVFISKRKALYRIERARLSFRTEELKHFFQTEKWRKKAVAHFRNSHIVRSQTKQEFGNIAFIHVRERWQELKQGGKLITGGLVFRMVTTYLKKYNAKDTMILFYPHPERVRRKKDLIKLAKVGEEKLSWKESQRKKDRKIDFEKLRNTLSVEGSVVLDGKLTGETNNEIIDRLEALGYRSGSKFLYGQLDEIRECLINLGYP